MIKCQFLGPVADIGILYQFLNTKKEALCQFLGLKTIAYCLDHETVIMDQFLDIIVR